jgi:penicillin G amidase
VRWLKRILVVLVALALGLAAFAVFTVRNSFPQVRGELEVDGLVSNVEILRDDLGVPHIYATNRHDLFFAQGYTHAQDRFWQMDFWRHIGAGRLSEMFGESQVDTDRFLRSMGWEALASEEWERMESPYREVLQSYADGVNAYLDTHHGSEISLEYAILPLQNSGYEIEPWSPVNTLTWGKVMSWDLDGNLADEIARAVLGRDLTPEQVADLYPPFPADKPVIVEQPVASNLRLTADVPDGAIAPLMSAADASGRLWALTGGGFEGIGSNNWVVSGDLTASGRPLLANDTHLANQMPSIWYENGLHCTVDAVDCDFAAVGFSFAGTPGVIIGHNAHHAWGVTTEASDTQDLFIEKVNPADPGQYEVEGEWVDFDVREETIEVAGGDDVVYEVKTSRHGPVISGSLLEEDELTGSSTVDEPELYAVALAWEALQPSTLVEAILGIDMASTYEEFAEAVALWDIASQNVIYADVEGNIAYHSTGEIPIRAGGDGLYPVPGWTKDHDWIGVVPTADMPVLLNPAQGFIATANQPILRPGSTPLIGIDGAYGYRAARIGDMIEAEDAHTVATMQAIQFDAREVGAEIVVPHLLAIDVTGSEGLDELQTELEGWATGSNPYQAAGASTGAAIYEAVWRHLLAATFHDELPEGYWPSGGGRWFEIVRTIIDTPDNAWWDDVGTPEVESRDDILLTALRDARSELIELLGPDRSDWDWGAMHIGRFENQTLGQSGIGPVEWLFNRTAPARVGGSTSLVDAVGWDAASSYEVDWVPSERMVVDLGDLDGSTFIHTTGQSGHAFAGDYVSMLEMWTDGRQAPMPWSRDAVDGVAEDRLVLVAGR